MRISRNDRVKLHFHHPLMLQLHFTKYRNVLNRGSSETQQFYIPLQSFSPSINCNGWFANFFNRHCNENFYIKRCQTHKKSAPAQLELLNASKTESYRCAAAAAAPVVKNYNSFVHLKSGTLKYLFLALSRSSKGSNVFYHALRFPPSRMRMFSQLLYLILIRQFILSAFSPDRSRSLRAGNGYCVIVLGHYEKWARETSRIVCTFVQVWTVCKYWFWTYHGPGVHCTCVQNLEQILYLARE